MAVNNKAKRENLQYASPVPTYHLQARIPQLPLPRLEDTCSRYLQSIKVTTSQAEYEESQRVVKQFQEGVGKGASYYNKELQANYKMLRYPLR